MPRSSKITYGSVCSGIVKRAAKESVAAKFLHGDCLVELQKLPDNSVDSIVTDPPYGLTSARPGGRSEATRGAVMGGFMGLSWDSDVPPVEVWSECIRVLKPGGHLLAFAGTRTQHRMAARIEDAGFEIRDMIAWVYGSGFPKSKNIAGGWGTALKPAMEPITVARKPFTGTVAVNVATHGVGALNIDGCRVAPTGESRFREGEASQERRYAEKGSTNFAATPGVRGGSPLGRWPANIIHDGSEDVLGAFPDAPGQQGDLKGHSKGRLSKTCYGDMKAVRDHEARRDAGSAARFFYCAKASRKERGEDNNHPTVKPVELMRWLVRLVTPKDGICLDPFMGSGTTGIAAKREGVQFIGIEREKEFLELAKRRVSRD